MANEFGLFWDSVNADRVYNASSFEEWLRKFFTTGVFNGELQVTEDNGMNIQVATGYANLNGKVRFFDVVNSFTIEPANGQYPRIDTVVVERNDTDRDITMKVVKGTYSGINPQPTPPVRSGGVYQIVLANVLVNAGVTSITQADITDKRADNTVCGWVVGTVDRVDVEQMTAQAQADFETWFERMKDQLDSDAAGHLQNEIDGLATDIDELATEVENVVTKLYPVGSIYLSVNNVDPSTIFGGTWVQLKDRFLLGAGDTYTAGTTGGEAEHTLTARELPAGVLGIRETNPDFLKELNGMSAGTGFGWLGRNNNGAPVEPITNMPPYLTVYMWQRTA